MNKVWFPVVAGPTDGVSALAFRRGTTAKEVWEHPKNRDLRDLRPNPDVLLPGDLVWLPAADDRSALPISPGAVEEIVADPPVLTLKVRLLDRGGAAIKQSPFEVQGAVGQNTGQTSGDGTVTFDVAVGTKHVSIHLPEFDLCVPVIVGGLAPLSTAYGAMVRLANLGYYEITQRTGDDERAYRRVAISAFQQDFGIPITGRLDKRTRDKLKEVAGDDGSCEGIPAVECKAEPEDIAEDDAGDTPNDKEATLANDDNEPDGDPTA